MTSLTGISRWRRLALLMALSACAMQALGYSLPSLVICCRSDRPPQVEFFVDSCSCRQGAGHFDCHHDAPCLEAACTDIHLGAPVAVAAAASRLLYPAGSRRIERMNNERSLAMTGAVTIRLACLRRGSPRSSAPPPPPATPARSRLRC